MKKNGDGQPVVDSSQDYVLLLGYENQTHTVLRFKRKLDTCDVAYDVPITVSVLGWGWDHVFHVCRCRRSPFAVRGWAGLCGDR